MFSQLSNLGNDTKVTLLHEKNLNTCSVGTYVKKYNATSGLARSDSVSLYTNQGLKKVFFLKKHWVGIFEFYCVFYQEWRILANKNNAVVTLQILYKI